MKRRTIRPWTARAALVLGLLGCSIIGSGQGLNNLWLGGFDSDGPPPFGGVDLDFQNGSMVISTVSRAIGYRRTSANLSDESGNLLFSTNGAFVANALGDTMVNGNGLSPGWYADQYAEGLAIPQGVLILPKPEDPHIYYLFHTTLDVWATASALHLYLSVIDMSLDGGLGAVTVKNQVLIADELNSGKLSAVRHANGRDWWVFSHRLNTDTFYRLLVTPVGVSVDGTQSIGAVHPPDAGQVCFSPDGNSFAYFYDILEVYPFDRCTGLFSEPILATGDQFEPGRGVAFSSSGRFLYTSTVEDVYQFDLDAWDIATAGAELSASATVSVVSACAAEHIIPDGALASVVGSVYSGTTVTIMGQFIVDDDVLFQNCQVFMEAGAEIVVLPGFTLDVMSSSVTSCQQVMWKGITAQDGSLVRMRGSFVDDAENVVTALDGSTVWLRDNQFHNNRTTIHVPVVEGVPWNNVALYAHGNTFYSQGAMPQPYPGQATVVGAVGFAAFDVNYMVLDLTDGNNIIHHMSNGIVAHRSDVRVLDCRMLNIKPDGAYTYVGNGAGIYAYGGKGWNLLEQQGYGMDYTPSFEDCRWGIYTERMNV